MLTSVPRGNTLRIVLVMMRRKGLAVAAVAALVVFISPGLLGAETWRPWQQVKGTEKVAWHYRWDSAWNDYEIELRNGYDYAMSLKFVVSCGREKVTGFWTLKPGGVASFLERFSGGGASIPLSLQIVESEKQD